MPEPAATPPPSLLRYAAVALSLGLAGFVVVNAQFGCDAPADASSKAGDAPAKTEDAPAQSADAAGKDAAEAPKSEAQPAAPEHGAATVEAGVPEPGPAEANAPDTKLDKRVLMPASKSGGDFGAVPFPGEKTGVLAPAGADEAQQAHDAKQAPNAAPNQAPRQQAPQP